MNKKNPDPLIHQIDATDQILGRLACRIADLLRGKQKVGFANNIIMGDKVNVVNASKIKLSARKITSKVYYRHTGFPGGIKKETVSQVLSRNPSLVIRRAVAGMLPKNKLRAKWLKNLKISG